MQKCEIMLNDLIDSKRTNSNIKATIKVPSQTGMSKNARGLFEMTPICLSYLSYVVSNRKRETSSCWVGKIGILGNAASSRKFSS